MKIILLEEVPGLGQKGEIKTVKNGYAVNFLLPQNRAIIATAEKLKELEIKKSRQVQQEEREKEKALVLKPQMEKQILLFRRKAEKGKLFGSVTRSDIAKKLRELLNLKLEAGNVKLDKPIKELGESSVPVRLPGEVEATIKILVEEEK